MRYLADLSIFNQFEKHVVITQTYFEFKNAFEFINSVLSPCSPTRLGIALSYSYYLHEILNMPEQACELSKQAFDSALMELDAVENEDQLRNCKLFIQLLRDNLIIWTQEIDVKNKS